MNKRILEKEVQNYIIQNINIDPLKLIFKKSPFENITMKEIVEQIDGFKRAKKKLPNEFCQKGIYYPPKISLEQCSSMQTGLYKSALISGDSIIDITSGMGVDDYYFSKVFKKLYYCELNKNLHNITKHNFNILNINNVTFFNGDGIEFIKKIKKVDWIYADPGRRDENIKKVFLLSDCLPNIPKNLNHLFNKTNKILLKLSPLLDISSAINELKFVKEVHIVSVKNECKELLIILENEYTDEIKIKTINIETKQNQTFNFSKNKETTLAANFSEIKDYLYEPNSSIMKSGGFNSLSIKFNTPKLHPNSNLYTSEKLINEFPGKIFKIDKIINYDKKQIKKAVPEMKANISTRNFPFKIEEIKKKNKIKDGGEIYLFFTTNFENKPVVIKCKRIIQNNI